MEAEKRLRLRIYCDMNGPRVMKKNREMMPADDFKYCGTTGKFNENTTIL